VGSGVDGGEDSSLLLMAGINMGMAVAGAKAKYGRCAGDWDRDLTGGMEVVSTVVRAVADVIDDMEMVIRVVEKPEEG